MPPLVDPPRPDLPHSALPFCGDFEIAIRRDGTWTYRGTPINRRRLVKLFASVLRRESDGAYWLVTPHERGRIIVEDAPFLAVAVTRVGRGPEQVLRFRSNLDHEVEAGPDHPLRVIEDASSGEPRPYIMVRPGLEARILRAVFYELVDMAEPEGHVPEGAAEPRWGVWSQSMFFPLQRPKP